MKYFVRISRKYLDLLIHSEFCPIYISTCYFQDIIPVDKISNSYSIIEDNSVDVVFVFNDKGCIPNVCINKEYADLKLSDDKKHVYYYYNGAEIYATIKEISVKPIIGSNTKYKQKINQYKRYKLTLEKDKRILDDFLNKSKEEFKNRKEQ